MSFVSHHVLQGIHVKWCTNTIIGEVAVEATQIKVHSDVLVQITLGHGTKVPKITYLTELVEMIKMDTWITQFGVRMEKLRIRENHRRGPIRPVGLDKAGRPGTSTNDTPLFLRALGTHKWAPKHLEASQK